MNNKDEFFNQEILDDLDKQIAEAQSRPTLIKKLKDKKRQKAEKTMLDFSKDIEKYWYVYVFLVVSAIFTGTLGIYMGLAPYKSTTADGMPSIYFNTDLTHVLLAVVYFVAFITVTEVAFAIMKWLYFTREETNATQQYTTIVGMLVSGGSILATGVAGGMVIASNIAFLSEFVSIPANAQKWVVIAIPTLITTYTFLVSAYSLSSDSAASERLMREQERENELDHRTRIRSVEQIGMQQLQVAEIKRYQQLVLAGKITAADAQAAIRAKRTLKDEEIRQRRDIDDSGGVGDSPTRGK